MTRVHQPDVPSGRRSESASRPEVRRNRPEAEPGDAFLIERLLSPVRRLRVRTPPRLVRLSNASPAPPIRSYRGRGRRTRCRPISATATLRRRLGRRQPPLPPTDRRPDPRRRRRRRHLPAGRRRALGPHHLPGTRQIELRRHPQFAAASADGGTVLFSTNIAVSPEDTDEAFDVYKREPDGSFVLVSRGTDGGPGCGFGGDRPVALSADGRIAIFETRARLSPADHRLLQRSLPGRGRRGAAPDQHRADRPERRRTLDGLPRLGHRRLRRRPHRRLRNQSAARRRRPRPLDGRLRQRRRDDRARLDRPGQGGSAPPPNCSASRPTGTTIVFATKGRLIPSDLDRDRDVYLRRVASERTVLLSAEADPAADAGRPARDGCLASGARWSGSPARRPRRAGPATAP